MFYIHDCLYPKRVCIGGVFFLGVVASLRKPIQARPIYLWMLVRTLFDISSPAVCRSKPVRFETDLEIIMPTDAICCSAIAFAAEPVKPCFTGAT